MMDIKRLYVKCVIESQRAIQKRNSFLITQSIIEHKKWAT